MIPHAAPRPDQGAQIASKLQWLMLFRVAMITVLLGSTLVVNLRAGGGLSRDTTQALLAIIITTYGLTIVYAVLLKRIRAQRRFAQIQLLGDVLLNTALVYLTGEAQSVFLFMFSLNVLNAAILLYRPGALWMAGVCAAVILILVGHRWLEGQDQGMAAEQSRALLETGVVNLAALFVVALLSGYLAEQLKDTGARLQEADADVRHLRALNALIANSIQSGLVGYTASERRIFYVNPAAAHILHLDSDALMGREITSLFPEAPSHEGDAEAVPNTAVRWESRRSAAGEGRILGCNLSPLVGPDPADRGYVVVFQDLTEIRKMEGRLARSAHLAALGRMAAGMAHELRNPLASMSGSIQMLSDRPGLDEDDRRLMNIIHREADRLESLISDFLQYAGHRPLTREVVDLGLFLRETVDLFDHRPPSMGMAPIQIELSVSEAPQIVADAGALRQIVWNLLNNAAQAMETGGVIRVLADTTGGEARLQIIDQGRGIGAETMGRLFEPFFTTRRQGTGLGLALVHRLVERHGGRVEVESAPGAGATFTVALPLSGGGELDLTEDAS